MSDNRGTTPIAKDDFYNLRVGDSVLDQYGREWVCYKEAQPGHTTKLKVIFLQCQGYEPDYERDGMFWENQRIMCDDWSEGTCINADFCHPNARVIKAA